MRPVFAVAAAAAAVAVAAPVSPALASGFTLDLSAPSTPVVGRSMLLQATGTIPVEQIQFPYWFSLDAIPTRVASTCPYDRWVASQIANSTGGAIIVLSQREVPNALGAFTIPVGITPTAPGRVLLCAYTDDGETNTLAGASLTLNIQSSRALARAKARCRRLPTQRRRAACLRRLRHPAQSS
jgi:hypothetical protein